MTALAAENARWRKSLCALSFKMGLWLRLAGERREATLTDFPPLTTSLRLGKSLASKVPCALRQSPLTPPCANHPRPVQITPNMCKSPQRTLRSSQQKVIECWHPPWRPGCKRSLPFDSPQPGPRAPTASGPAWQRSRGSSRALVRGARSLVSVSSRPGLQLLQQAGKQWA